MYEEETKNCPNCKREIPATNFTIHTVHCARNIKVCPVCKEPVLSAELDDHHKKLHKLLPCKQCGESVCGTDLEDHIRDSCANTIKTCRFCELELPRRELPAHEGYCGVRTERCPECREYVMIKYRQLHLDSNHGFLRLDDDPAPVINAVVRPRANILPPAPPLRHHAISDVASDGQNSGFRGTPISGYNQLTDPLGSNVTHLSGLLRNCQNGSDNESANVANNSANTTINSANVAHNSANGDRPVSNGVKKRTNDQPQINTNTGATKNVDKHLGISKGAVKKRPAPPLPTLPHDPRRDMAYYSALGRRQREDRQRTEQNAYNFAHGLPPVLTPLEKIDKLRKMDALHNRESEEYARPARADRRRDEPRRVEPTRDVPRRVEPIRDVPRRVEPIRDMPRQVEPSRDELRQAEVKRDEFKDLKPMSAEQFAARFRSLQVADADRFTEIKTSLRELRRGLNEVTAPYNNNNTANNNNEQRGAEVVLPCEFCDQPVPADDLVQHQTGCRPDLARMSGRPTPGQVSARPTPDPPRAHSPPANEPMIPCEFCAQPLPYYLLTEHQERCARDEDISD